MTRLSWLVWLALLSAACGGGSGPLDLQITFPDEAARADTARLHLWVLEPGESATCAAFQDGSARPGDPGFVIEVEQVFTFPPSTTPTLPQVGPGLRLFTVEAEDGASQAFLRGCTRAEAGGGGPSPVVIALERVSSCTPTGPETCNGLDDDCDGATDQGTPEELCPSRPHAEAVACTAGQCEYQCETDWYDTNPEAEDGCECQLTNGGVEICDGEDNDCDGVTDGAGTPCDDGAACTEGDQCDEDGVCLGTVNGDYCGISELCMPGCATLESGCVRVPDSLFLDCPAEASLAAGPAACTLTAVNAPGTEVCASCTVSLLPSRAYTHSFGRWGACDPGDWAFEEQGCANSTGCDLGADFDRTCCDSYECDAVNGDGLWLSNLSCSGSRGFRLSRLFDFQPWERVRVCQQLKQFPPGGGGAFQVQVDPGDDLLGTLVTCVPEGTFGADEFSAPCADLPLAVTDQAQTRLTLRAELPQSMTGEESAIGLGQMEVYGYPEGCSQEVEMLRSTFEGCPEGSTEWDGWRTFGGSFACFGQAECGPAGGLVVDADGGTSSLSLTRDLTGPHRDFRLPAELCWSEVAYPGAQGSYRFTLSGGGGGVWMVLLSETRVEFFGWEAGCRSLCIDLGELASNARGSEFLNLGLEVEATQGMFVLQDVVLRHAQACPPNGVLQLTLGMTTTPAEILVTDLVGLPRRALVDCVWGDGRSATSREIEFR